jgi:hypothetical protein
MDDEAGEQCEGCIPVITAQRLRQAIDNEPGAALKSLNERIGVAGAEVITVSGALPPTGSTPAGPTGGGQPPGAGAGDHVVIPMLRVWPPGRRRAGAGR